MSASSMDAGPLGVAQTWPLQAVAAGVSVAPLPVSEAGFAAAKALGPRVRGDDGGVAEAVQPSAQPAEPSTHATRSSPMQATETLSTAPDPANTPARHPRESGDPATSANPSGVADSPIPATRADTTTPGTPQPAFGEPTGTAGAVGGTVLALLLVVGVILALAWLAKRMPGIAGSSNPSLKIVGSLALGPRERVVVVAVGDTQLLLSTGPHGTRALHTLSEPLPVTSASSSAFAQVLAQQFGRKKS